MMFKTHLMILSTQYTRHRFRSSMFLDPFVYIFVLNINNTFPSTSLLCGKNSPSFKYSTRTFSSDISVLWKYWVNQIQINYTNCGMDHLPFVPNFFRHSQVSHNCFRDSFMSRSLWSKKSLSQLSFLWILSRSIWWKEPAEI